MWQNAIHPQNPKRLLDPMDRISEVLFGLIMVLTFTGSFSAAQAGRADIREMLLGALGCNLAWGIIDGIMYLMACLSERGQEILTLRGVRRAGTAAEAYRAIAGALPEGVAKVLEPPELEMIRRKLTQLPEPPPRPRLHRDDWLGAFAVFLWVFVSTFPVAIPFIFMHDGILALRISNIIAVGMLFLTGHAFGRCIGYRPWVLGFSMVLIGSALAGLAILLGG
jgi:VIT1/CCC1 family predicted Fe2+/Mn2+ transporter